MAVEHQAASGVGRINEAASAVHRKGNATHEMHDDCRSSIALEDRNVRQIASETKCIQSLPKKAPPNARDCTGYMVDSCPRAATTPSRRADSDEM